MRKNRCTLLLVVTVIVLLSVSCSTARMGMMHGGDEYGSMYQQEVPLNLNEAENMLEAYVRSADNPNLKAGNIKEEKDAFVGEIVTKDGSLVDTVWIDKYTGTLNTRYGRKFAADRGERPTGGTWRFCPYCGNRLDSGRYHAMRPMMRHGYGMHYGMHRGMGFGATAYFPWDPPEDVKDAARIMEMYLEEVGNPNLKTGKIEETETGFEADIVTKKSEDTVNRVVIDKNTGRIQSVF